MFDINACYKVIFEALFEQEGIDHMVQKVHEYTNAFIYLLLQSGELLACACSEEEKKAASIRNKHITISEYEAWQPNIRKTEHAVYSEKWNRYYHIAEFEVGGKRIGYSILAFEREEEKVNMEKVNAIFCQALGMYFKDVKLESYENVSMRRQICGWTIFSEEIYDKNNLDLLKKEIPGKYFLVYISCRDQEKSKQRMSRQIHGIWNNSLFDFNGNNLCTLFFGADESNREMLMSELRKLGYSICVSELFTDLEACPQKRDFLERMDSFDGYWKNEGIMEEKDWYVETVFSYAASMFSEAGLNDYFIEQLCKSDSEKNLELFDTLKMYLLCENNISATASKLHVHRNTLVYRLKQIQNCIGRNINDNNASKELLSFMVMFDIVRQNGD